MKSVKKCFFIFTFILGVHAHADLLHLDEGSEKSQLSVSGEMSYFKIEEQSFTAQGIQIQYDYGMSDKLTFEGFFSMAFNSDSSMSSAYTGFGAYALYTVFGSCCQSSRSLTLNSKKILTEEHEFSPRVMVGAGLDQYLLTGSRGVYSASGLGGEVSYLFPLWRFIGRVNLKGSILSSGSQTLQSFFAGTGLVLQF